ncbi:MAG: transcription antitermination factor NusB [Schwartzia sp.]|nr:transcription antitermination factor NusB [Schwartzia sp. (in: firmicutes)]
MSRRHAREAAMQALFQLDMIKPAPDKEEEAQRQAVESSWKAGNVRKVSELDEGYASALVKGTRENLQSIDEAISVKSRGWKLSRMAAIDRSILRLAVYEMKYIEDVTPGIVINEAVELAKKFGSDDSARFINGVLGAMVEK